MEKVKLLLKNPLFYLILVAVFFRFYHLSAMVEFLGDQGRDVLIVRDLLKNGNLVFIGPQTSIGNMYLGPFYYYLIAPSLLLAGFSPLGPAVLIAILGVLTVFLMYRFAQHLFGSSTAFLLALWFAVSPVIIRYSTFSWNPNIMPLLALGVFWSWWQIWTHKQTIWLVLLALFLAIALQSHYLALLLFIPSGCVVFASYCSNRQDKKYRRSFLYACLLALVVFCLFLLPQVLFDLRHNGQNLQALVTFFTVRQTTVNLKAYKALPNIWPLFTQVNTRLLTATNQHLGTVISWLMAIPVLVYGAISLTKHKKPSDYLKANFLFLVLVLWYVTGVIGLGLYKQHIYDHYFGFLYPVPFLLVGFLLSKLPKPAKLFAICLVVGLIAVSCVQSFQAFRYPRYQLSHTSTIANFITKKAAGESFNFALLAKTNYDDAYLYYLLEQGANLLDQHGQIGKHLFVVCEPHPDITCFPEGHPQWEVATFGPAKVTGEWVMYGRKVYQLEHVELN